MNRAGTILKKELNRLTKSGFFSIVLSNTLAKVVALLGGTVLVRVLSKTDYGLYSYVVNAMSLLLILGDMGTGVAAFQLMQENYHDIGKVKGYCAYAIRLIMLFSIPLSIIVLLSPYFYPYKLDGAIELTRLLFAIPLINNLNTFLQTNLRSHLLNDRFSALNIMSVIIHYGVLLPLSFVWGVKGAILAQYGYGIITLIIALVLNRNHIYICKKDADLLTKREKKEFLKLSIPTQLNAMITQVLLLVDVFLIGLIFADENIIASYKVATVIPSAVAFIPTSIMLFVLPYFARNKDNYKWVKDNYAKLLLATISIALLIAGGGIATAKYIIPFMFGKQYEDAILCYVILLCGFVFSGGFQIPSVNIIYTQRKIKVNLIITVTCGLLNIFFDIFGLMLWGSIGAAIATALTSFVGGIASTTYMIWFLRKKGIEKGE